MSARIEKLLGLATLQGPPITGYRKFGVPPGGAFDQESYRLANALVGNSAEEFAIELSNAAIEIVFGMSARVAVVGAAFAHANSAFDVSPGQRLSISAPAEGLRTYVAVTVGWIPDGIDSPLGRAGRRLTAGDVLEHGEAQPAGSTKRLSASPTSLTRGPFRTIGGEPMRLKVSNDSDRTGIRLDGLPPREAPELPSEPICVGAIQQTPSGQLIVIGPDGPTIGGYPRIGYVCSADLDRLAHLRPGQEISLAPITLEEAQQLAKEREAEIERRVRLIGLSSVS